MDHLYFDLPYGLSTGQGWVRNLKFKLKKYFDDCFHVDFGNIGSTVFFFYFDRLQLFHMDSEKIVERVF